MDYVSLQRKQGYFANKQGPNPHDFVYKNLTKILNYNNICIFFS